MPVVSSEKRKEIFKEHGGSEANTGSVEAQIALFTARINHLTEHLKENKKKVCISKIEVSYFKNTSKKYFFILINHFL